LIPICPDACSRSRCRNDTRELLATSIKVRIQPSFCVSGKLRGRCPLSPGSSLNTCPVRLGSYRTCTWGGGGASSATCGCGRGGGGRAASWASCCWASCCCRCWASCCASSARLRARAASQSRI
jgi:hypothetical protein